MKGYKDEIQTNPNTWLHSFSHVWTKHTELARADVKRYEVIPRQRTICYLRQLKKRQKVQWESFMKHLKTVMKFQ